MDTINLYKDLIKLDPTNSKIWVSMALFFEETNQIDEAINAYKKVIELNPEEIFVYKKLADINYFVKNSPSDTIKYFNKFLEFEPENADAKACQGLAYLKMKNFKKGWELFEHRPYKENAILEGDSRMKNFISNRPFWNGEDIKDKILYVFAEAGFGDTLMFARYLPLLKEKCKKVLFEPEISSVNLFKDSDLGVDIVDSRVEDYKRDYDFHTSVMSLPALLGLNTEADIPLSDGYLKANSQNVKRYSEKFFRCDDFKIGIKWQGKIDSKNLRAIPLEAFFEILKMPNVKFYSFQKGAGLEQLEDAKQFNITNLGATFEDFADTAAAIENVDLVICNDTSVAHLAGALGKKCWVLLPYVQDWRWSEDLTYCTWYKNVKLFKQNAPGDWSGVIDRVFSELNLLEHN